MTTAVVLFNRLLRLRDHPALATAARRADRIIPLFVLDPAILHRHDGPPGWGLSRSPNREAFLAESLADLRAGLRDLGADLVLRVGDPAAIAVALARELNAETIHYTDDVTGFAVQRQDRLSRLASEAGVAVCAHPGIGVIEANVLTPSGGDHFKVFTPYFRVWSGAARRPLAAIPKRMVVPAGLDPGPEINEVLAVSPEQCSPRRPPGGETAGRRRWADWRRTGGLHDYAEHHDGLATDATSRLSPYLHFGCLSPLELVMTAQDRHAGGIEESEGPAAFVRQLCWRDFYSQVTAAFPAIAHRPYRPRPSHADPTYVDSAQANADGNANADRDRDGDEDEDGASSSPGRAEQAAFEAWASGRTGFPVVDAGMTQLLDEGWMHNRARLITASFLVKDLGLDWRLGAAHFQRWLTDGDVAQNSANWQWVAGTGNDTRPNRRFNPNRQAERFDPDGAYVRRHLPQLDAWAGATLEGQAGGKTAGKAAGKMLHRLATMDAVPLVDRPADYPEPIVEHRQHTAPRRDRAGQ